MKTKQALEHLVTKAIGEGLAEYHSGFSSSGRTGHVTVCVGIGADRNAAKTDVVMCMVSGASPAEIDVLIEALKIHRTKMVN